MSQGSSAHFPHPSCLPPAALPTLMEWNLAQVSLDHSGWPERYGRVQGQPGRLRGGEGIQRLVQKESEAARRGSVPALAEQVPRDKLPARCWKGIR